MSLEPRSHTHHDPHDARRASEVGPDGTPRYRCLRCGRPKRKELFATNDHGRVNDLCIDCERQVSLGVPQRRYMKDRSHITVTSKVCKVCGEDRPSDEFWLDGKSDDGLKSICGDCERRRREYKSAGPPAGWASYQPASAIQPALDQAITERDALAGDVERLQALVTELQRVSQNQAPRTDLLALNAIETEIRWLREQLEAKAPDDAVVPRYVRKGIQQACLLVGPVAYAVFKWADRQVQGAEDQPEKRKARK